MGRPVTCESNIALSPSKLKTCYTNSTKVVSMSLHEGNMHVYDFAHGSLGHAIEHGQVIGSFMAFSVSY